MLEFKAQSLCQKSNRDASLPHDLRPVKMHNRVFCQTCQTQEKCKKIVIVHTTENWGLTGEATHLRSLTED